MTATGDLFDNLRSYALAIQCTLINIDGQASHEVDAGYDSSTIQPEADTESPQSVRLFDPTNVSSHQVTPCVRT